MIFSQWKVVDNLNKRENIIEAATTVFMEKGTEKTTISDIVKKAGIAQGTFYLYFPTKLAVMPAIADELVDKLLSRFKEEVDGEELDDQLRQIIDIIFNHTEEYKELTKLVYTGLTQTPYLGDWERIYDPLYNWIENLLIKAQDKNQIRSDVHSTYAAKILVGMIESAAEQIYLFDKEESKSIHTHYKELYNMVYYALAITK